MALRSVDWTGRAQRNSAAVEKDLDRLDSFDELPPSDFYDPAYHGTQCWKQYWHFASTVMFLDHPLRL